MTCEWCQSNNVQDTMNTVYWELPDGSRTVEIFDTPSVKCNDCGMEYQTEALVQEIEDHLFLINTKNLERKLSYSDLMSVEKILKKNYFKF
ncbi:YokU family protein [Bacillus sp. RG28]|uniref:YokU family protein n=1 Tax=Gottfriedia endophytica TaxID=2820819 RepID=A0A940NWW0_9BACI|nr:YokU family protein [Gottfriedia endophytica]MBP0726448.1 YokU family protein [Gottfriedia endophytica]